MSPLSVEAATPPSANSSRGGVRWPVVLCLCALSFFSAHLLRVESILKMYGPSSLTPSMLALQSDLPDQMTLRQVEESDAPADRRAELRQDELYGYAWPLPSKDTPVTVNCSEYGYEPREDQNFRIIHAATYHGETSVLRLALYEIFHHVDVIVLVDSNTTFTGMHSSVERIADLLPVELSAYAGKIRYIRAEEHISYAPHTFLEDQMSNWIREFATLNTLSHGWQDVQPQDLVVQANIDEFPSRKFLHIMRQCQVVKSVPGWTRDEPDKPVHELPHAEGHPINPYFLQGCGIHSMEDFLASPDLEKYRSGHLPPPAIPFTDRCEFLDIRAMMYFFNLRCRVRDMWYIGPNVVPATCLSTMTVNTMRWNTEDDVYVKRCFQLDRQETDLSEPFGYHLSSFLNGTQLADKLRSYSHSAPLVDHPKLQDAEYLEEKMKECKQMYSETDMVPDKHPQFYTDILPKWAPPIRR